MTAASTGNPQKSDDLTTISGIGTVRAKLLRESLGVHSFQDLAALSVDELESQLRAEGQFVSRNEIAQWIAEARELAAVAVEEQANSPTPGPEWESAATFVVEFQVREEGEERRTRVHHIEEDVDANWPDVEPVQLCRWMLEQLGEPTPGLSEDVLVEARQELEQELQQMRTDARQKLQEELVAERSRLQKEIEQELEERKAEARQALEQEVQERRTKVQQELDDEFEAGRARLQQQFEQDLQELKVEAQQALEEELAAERSRLQKEIEQELEERKAEAQQALEEELAAERSRLQKEIEQELEERRAEAQRLIEQELQQMRVEAREALVPTPEAPAEVEVSEEEAAREPEPEAPAEAVPEPAVVAQPPELRITELRVYQPPGAETPRTMGKSPTSPDVLARDTPFALLVSFNVDEARANELAGKGVIYTAQFRARELPTGEILQLGATRPEKYVAGRSTYEARLPDVTLPAGLYQLATFVTTGTMPPAGVYHQVFMLLMA